MALMDKKGNVNEGAEGKISMRVESSVELIDPGGPDTGDVA
jgi:hypothetical protein